MNKRAMLDDALDLLFMVVVTVFGFLFVYGMLISSTASQKSQQGDSIKVTMNLLENVAVLKAEEAMATFPETYQPISPEEYPPNPLDEPFLEASPTQALRKYLQSLQRGWEDRR